MNAYDDELLTPATPSRTRLLCNDLPLLVGPLWALSILAFARWQDRFAFTVTVIMALAFVFTVTVAHSEPRDSDRDVYKVAGIMTGLAALLIAAIAGAVVWAGGGV